MIIYPVKWLPYILIVGGILVVVFEGDVLWGLCLVGMGVAGLYIKKKFFDSTNNVQNNDTQNTNAQTTNWQSTTTQNVNPNVNHSNTTSAMNFCGKCGSKIQPGDLFCENCGTKLNG